MIRPAHAVAASIILCGARLAFGVSTPTPEAGAASPPAPHPDMPTPGSPRLTGGSTPEQQGNAHLKQGSLSAIRSAIQADASGTRPGGSNEEAVQDLNVIVRGGRVVLTGKVPSQAAKEAAGARASAAAAGRQIENRLIVK